MGLNGMWQIGNGEAVVLILVLWSHYIRRAELHPRMADRKKFLSPLTRLTYQQIIYLKIYVFCVMTLYVFVADQQRFGETCCYLQC
jgi:hypothetical protein